MATQKQMAEVMEKVFDELRDLRQAGQEEYARREEEAFSNFQRVGESLGLDQKQILLVYLEKHIDGIHSYVQGHKSQREDVRGRICDAMVYLTLLRGMIDEEEGAGIFQTEVEPGRDRL